MTASQRPERVDRDALIEAAGFAVARDRSAPYGPQTEDYECATAVLDAVLPLIADAIEDPIRHGESVHYEFCSLVQAGTLVRSFGRPQ